MGPGAAAAQDGDLLTSLRRDACLPWVTGGIAPEGHGRVEIVAPAALVLISARERANARVAARIDGGRFEAVWAVTGDASPPATHFCSIGAAPGDAFAIAGDVLVPQVTGALAGRGLVADKTRPDLRPGILT